MARISIAAFVLLFLAAGNLALPRHSLSAVDHSAFETVKECVGCHPRALPTHKQRSPQEMAEDWPLDTGGRMLCITCHDCISGTCILRKPKPELCQVCHDCSQGMACMIGSAHLGDSPQIDVLVYACVVCHDGVIAAEGSGPGNHRINVLYLPGKHFRRVEDRRVVFVDGKVTCVSCHNPYASEAARLVKSNAQSSLCLTCHIR